MIYIVSVSPCLAVPRLVALLLVDGGALGHLVINLEMIDRDDIRAADTVSVFLPRAARARHDNTSKLSFAQHAAS